MGWRSSLALIGCLQIAWCADIDATALLARARAKVVDEAARIPQYVCRQQIERKVYFPNSRKEQNCAAMLAQRSLNPLVGMYQDSEDRAKLDVMLSNGGELFAWPGGRAFNAQDPGDLLAGGMSGSGDFASFRIDIFTNPDVAIHYQGTCGESCARFIYEVPPAASHYVLRTHSDAVTIAYHGTLDVSSPAGDLLKLTVIAAAVEKALPEVCAVRSEINYSRANTGEFMLPADTEKDLILRDGSYFANTTAYKGCRQYSSQSSVSFEDETQAPRGAESAKASSPPAFETVLQLRLISKIDPGSSFAGDAIEEALTKAVRDVSGGRIPVGTVFRGHLAEMARRIFPRAETVVAIRLDSVVLGGKEVPITLEPMGLSDARGRGIFVFPGTKPVGGKLLSRWRVR